MIDLLLALVQAAAAPAPPPGVAFVAPEFEQLPGDMDLAAAYPPEAKGAPGAVGLRCTVTQTRALAGCRVIAEEPGTVGFAAAALRLAPLYRLNPTLSDGRPVRPGGRIDLVVRFEPPPPPPEAVPLA